VVRTPQPSQVKYRGHLAPSPTGFLHLGHARTFWTAQERARAGGGILVLRNEDLDAARCKPEFAAAMLEDLRWFGFQWQEGPDCGGPYAPYQQSDRFDRYRAALDTLRAGGFVYPCVCSRRDIQAAARAPHAGDDEALYPGTCRPGERASLQLQSRYLNDCSKAPAGGTRQAATPLCWRFRVPDGETVGFADEHFGPQRFVVGRDFGDFVVWRNDGVPAYQLACVVDDAAMAITEVVRGRDLLLSTARQLLLYDALGLPAPRFYHCALMTDATGTRLAKRHAALSLRSLRAQGARPEDLRRERPFASLG
jgi:glutamyl/glutaminyl-tRNA synthetase